MIAKENLHFYLNPNFWLSLLFLSASLMIFGWVRSYPLNYSPAELPVLSTVSPFFWLGLWLSFIFLSGLVLTTLNRYVILASVGCFAILFTSPQFLYYSYGSDAGILAEFVNYSNTYDQFELSRDIAVNSYYQWPLSIFFHQFLADILLIDVYETLSIAFFFIILGISGGFFYLWHSLADHRPGSIRAVFWGTAIYFCSLFWIVNWQTVPFTFALVLFIPLLALLVDHSIQGKILFVIFFIALVETHAMLGFWLLIIASILFALNYFRSKELSRISSYSMVLLMVVVLVSFLVYKNTRFFTYVISSLQGFHSQISLMATSDRALALQTKGALNNVPINIIGKILKIMSWISLAIGFLTFLISALIVFFRHRVQIREISFVLAGLLYFIIGTQMANLGIIALLLIGLAPAYFLIDNLKLKTNTSKILLLFCILSIILFPSALIRSHQNSINYIIPADLFIRDFLSTFDENSEVDFSLLREPSKPYLLNNKFNTITRSTITNNNNWSCSGHLLVVDTEQLRNDLTNISPELRSALISSYSQAPQFYDNGLTKLRYLNDCEPLNVLN